MMYTILASLHHESMWEPILLNWMLFVKNEISFYCKPDVRTLVLFLQVFLNYRNWLLLLLRPILSINMKFTSHIEIEKIIKSLQCYVAFGYDEIPTKILKACAKTISSPLACTCNRSLASGIFPSWLKFSILNPIFQKGNKYLCLIIDQCHSYPHLIEFLKK